jgi:peptidyl-dipeptidase A
VPPTASSPAAREVALTEFVTQLVRELEPLERAHNEATWACNVRADREAEARSIELEARIRTLFSHREPYQWLTGVREAGGVPDARMQRQLELLVNNFRAHQIAPEAIERMVRLEKSLESRFNQFRARLDGRMVSDNALRDVLRGSGDAEERRAAWQASKQIGAEVAPDLLALVGMRNEAARAIGFPSYYSMMLALDEIDEAALFADLDRIERGTRAPFERWKQEFDTACARRFGVAPQALAPWHYADPFFQEAPPAEVALDRWFADRSLEQIAAAFFAAVGFPLDDLLPRADLYEREGKSQHAFCLSVDRGGDVRVLCNLRPNEHWMGTLLHEFGHAVYDVRIDRTLPFLLRGPAHTNTTEASAMLFGRLARNAAWLERWAGVPAAEARAIGEACRRAQRAQLLVQTRWMLVMCHMERALYSDPTQDLDALWWRLVGEFQRVRTPEPRRAPDWASKVHFSVAPVYYHNYLLGEITASQLQRHLLSQVTGWADLVQSPDTGHWLTESLYRHGRIRDWRETLRHATGRALDVDAYLAELEE